MPFMKEPAKLLAMAAIGTGIGFAVVAELCSDDFMLHIISSYVFYDELAGMALGLLVGMAAYCPESVKMWIQVPQLNACIRCCELPICGCMVLIPLQFPLCNFDNKCLFIRNSTIKAL